MSQLAAVAAGLGSAACFGAASAGQHLVASTGTASHALDPRLLRRLVRQRAWLVASALEAVAVLLQVLALRWGAVSLVQPLLVLGLPLAVLLAARAKRQHVTRLEWVGLLLCAVGVAVVAALLPGGSPQRGDAPLHSLLILSAVLLVSLGVSAVVPGRTTSGACAGVCAGVGAAALALCGPRLTQPVELLTSWPAYVALLSGVLALQLGQAAFQEQRLGAPLAALTLAEPVAAVALSAWVLHEQLASGAGTWLAITTATALAAAGVLLVLRFGVVSPDRQVHPA